MNRLAIALGALLIAFCGMDGAKAQTQTQPFYGVVSPTGAKGMQAVDYLHGLPVGAPAVATCGGRSLTAGIVYPLAQDLTGTLCTVSSGGGGGAATIANGADVAEGSTTDAPCVSGSTTPCTVESRLAHIENLAAAPLPAQSNHTTNIGMVDLGDLNGTIIPGGNGTTTIGSPRVTIASDNTAFSVNSILAAETTKVIGTVNQGTSPWVTSGTSTVSGTVSATQGTSPWIVAGGGTAGTAASGVLTIQGIASMTKLLVTPDSVALPANQSVNVAQFGGVSTSTGQVAVSTAPVTATNTALVTALRPDSPGIVTLGQTTKSASVPMAIASDQLGGATVANSLPVITSSQYPANATAAAAPITASATGTTGATTATLAGVSSKTTFICGFTITSDATAALAGSATVTGTITGTMNYIQNVGGATAAGILTQSFAPCIPASTTNTGIAVNSVAAGTGGNTAVTAWGYQL